MVAVSWNVGIWIPLGGGFLEACEVSEDALELTFGLHEAEHRWTGEVGERAGIALAVARAVAHAPPAFGRLLEPSGGERRVALCGSDQPSNAGLPPLATRSPVSSVAVVTSAGEPTGKASISVRASSRPATAANSATRRGSGESGGARPALRRAGWLAALIRAPAAERPRPLDRQQGVSFRGGEDSRHLLVAEPGDLAHQLREGIGGERPELELAEQRTAPRSACSSLSAAPLAVSGRRVRIRSTGSRAACRPTNPVRSRLGVSARWMSSISSTTGLRREAQLTNSTVA